MSDDLLKRLDEAAKIELGDMAETKWWLYEKFKDRAPVIQDMLSHQAAARIRDLEAQLIVQYDDAYQEGYDTGYDDGVGAK